MLKDIDQKVIALDGTAGSGKGTIGKLLAKSLNYDYLDTGKMFRAVALTFLNNGVASEEISQKIYMVDAIDFSRISSSDLYSSEVGEFTSQIALNQDIRQKLCELQRDFVAKSSKEKVVVDGRDIGTVVFPNAFKKFYFDAELRERALRKFKELQNKGKNTTLSEVSDFLSLRDMRDKTRSVAPLKKGHDCILVNTTSLTVGRTLSNVLNLIKTPRK